MSIVLSTRASLWSEVPPTKYEKSPVFGRFRMPRAWFDEKGLVRDAFLLTWVISAATAQSKVFSGFWCHLAAFDK
jgi:hypothetical protein